MLNVVLINPEIPPNTGNIGRLTLGTGTNLKIVGEPNFDLDSDKALRRAGLDYWDDVDVDTYPDWLSYKSTHSGKYILATKFAERSYEEVDYHLGDSLLFGGETGGVPRNLANDPTVTPVCLPMTESIRAYNVCNVAAVILFEAIRQVKPDELSLTPFSETDETHTRTLDNN